MLVFEATDQLQGQRSTDYHHAWTGELVYLAIQECKDPECGCTRGFAGFDSHRATTTARVADRPDLSIETLSRLLATSLCDGGWLDAPDPGAELVSWLEIPDHGLAVGETDFDATLMLKPDASPRLQVSSALEGITDPEEKREAITQTFYKKVFGRIVKESRAKHLLQGTILTDVDETVESLDKQIQQSYAERLY